MRNITSAATCPTLEFVSSNVLLPFCYDGTPAPGGLLSDHAQLLAELRAVTSENGPYSVLHASKRAGR